MISYIFKVSMIWALCYFFYWVLLRNNTFFRFNRYYLLATLLFPLIIPLLPSWYEAPVIIKNTIIELNTIVVTAEQSAGYSEIISVKEAAPFTAKFLLLVVYRLGVLLVFARMLHGCWQIFSLYRLSEVRKADGYVLVLTDKLHLPFSFLQFIFWSREFPINNEKGKTMLSHEKAHVRAWHSIDVLMVELISVLAWFSPMIYLYRNAFKINHEYMADAMVTQNKSIKKYGHLLIQQSLSGPQIALVNYFFHSQLKKRLHMLTKKRSSRTGLLAYLLAIPFLAGLTMAFSPQANELISSGDSQILIMQKDTFPPKAIHFGTGGIIEERQEYKGEVAITLNGADFSGADRPLVFINGSLYTPPADVIELSVDGSITFLDTVSAFKKYGIKIGKGILELNGKDVEITRSPNLEPNEGQLLYEGLTGKQSAAKTMEIFKIVDQVPLFEGCENTLADYEDRKRCSDEKLLNFIHQNIEYPESCKASNIEGTVVAEIVINAEGMVSRYKIARSVHQDMDQEVLRVIKQLPRWTPGLQAGKPVAVELAIPVKFKLRADKQSKDRSNAALPPNTLELRDFQLTPNPASDQIKVQFSGKAQPLRLMVTSYEGKMHINQMYNGFNGFFNETLNLESLSQGPYLLMIGQEGKIFAQPFVIQ